MYLRYSGQVETTIMSFKNTFRLAFVLAATSISFHALAQDQTPVTLSVACGGEIRYELQGADYADLSSVRVMRRVGRSLELVIEVTCTLEDAARDRRVLLIRAAPQARIESGLVLQGLRGRVSATLPLRLDVVAARSRVPIVIERGSTRSINLQGPRYAHLSELRVFQGGRAAQGISGSVEKLPDGVRLELAASDTAVLSSDLVVEGKIGERWVSIPFELTTARRAADPIEAELEPQVLILPDGTRVVLGPRKVNGAAPTTSVPSPIPTVNGWSPAKIGETSGIVTITGTHLPNDATVHLGGTPLQIQSRSSTQIVARFPATSPQQLVPLVVAGGSGAAIRTCEAHYWLKGDRAWHHINANATTHQWLTSYLLGLASYHVYGAPGESWNAFKAGFTAKYRELGMLSFDFIQSTEGGHDTQLAIAANPHVIVIAFRGSEQKLADWMGTDFNLWKRAANDWRQGAWVHNGFYEAYDNVHNSLMAKVQALRTSNQPIYFTGHSLGGALANMGAFRFRKAGLPVQGVYTYGGPRVGNNEWKLAYNAENLGVRTHRWVNQNDPIPRHPGLPSPGWEHVGRCNNIFPDNIKINDSEIAFGVFFSFLTHHDQLDYLDRIYNALSSANKAKVPNPPKKQ